MNPEPAFELIEDLFHRAMKVPAAERGLLIESLTEGHPELRTEVFSLVQAAAALDRLHTNEPSAQDARGKEAEAASDANSAIGMRLGAFELDRLLGRGGMGEVYAGHRVAGGPEQRIAVKLISARLDSPRLRMAFFRERDALAQLQHPHIARLLDGGVTANNAPYLVMEIVGDETAPAERIDEYCERRSLPLEGRIQLAIQVCDAIAYAHGKLIVHGDLKPANVLVASDGQAKLLDFGAARLLAADDTGSRVVAFTPGYASPEQLQGSPITVASDVYSMGKLLERLLPGLQNAELCAAIDRCTREQPDQRYASIERLANDLRAWLGHLPLDVCKGRRGYALNKWLSRNRIAVVASMIVLAVLAASIVLMRQSARHAIAERDRALSAAKAVETLAHRLLFDFQPQLRDMGSSTEAQHQLAMTTVSYLNELARDPSLASDALRLDMVHAYTRLGNLLGNPYDENLGKPRDAETTLQKAIAVAGDLGRQEPRNYEALYGLAVAEQSLGEVRFGEGETQASLQAMNASVNDFSRLTQSGAATAEEYMAAGAAWGSLGDINGMADSDSLDRKDEAMKCYRMMIALNQRAVDLQPGYVRGIRSIAVGEYKLADMALDKNPSEAAAGFRRVIAVLDTLPVEARAAAPTVRLYIISGGHLGRAYMRLGKKAEALAAMKQTLDRSEALVAADPEDDRARFDLSSVQTGFGDMLMQTGDLQGARRSYRSALKTIDFMLQRKPENKVLSEHRIELQKTLEDLDRRLAARSGTYG